MPDSFPPPQEKDNAVSPWKNDETMSYRHDGRGGFVLFLKIMIPVILLVAAGAFSYYYFLAKPSGATVSVEFSKPGQITAGQPFPLTVSFSNNSDQILKNAVLSVYLPDNVYYVNGSQNQRVIEKGAGDVGPGSSSPNVFNLIVVGDNNAIKNVRAKLSYQLGGSTAQFDNSGSADIQVGQQAINLSFEMPQSVFGNSDLDIKVNYQNNSGKDFTSDVILKMTYPSGFTLSKTSTDPSSGNNQWDLGKLPKGANGSFTITGKLNGPDSSSFDFAGNVSAGGVDFGGQNFTVAEQKGSVSISPSPLSLSLSINNSDNYVSKPADELFYSFHYKNKSSGTFENVTVKAYLSGEMFDFQSVRSDASFNSVDNSFTWMASNASALAKLSPGQEGTLTIDIRLKKDYPIRLISDKNFTLKTRAEISSPTVPQGTKAAKTFSVANFETKVAGKLQLQAKALWRDASSGIRNSGNYPPRVNQPTRYTIHWILTNYSTDVSKVQVFASLQSGARWTGSVKSNTSVQPVYDQLSGKVTWDVGDIMATKGVISPPAEAIFQVEVTPAVNQLGQYVTFLSNSALQWQDNFINAPMNDSTASLTTLLMDDPTIGVMVNRTVQQ